MTILIAGMYRSGSTLLYNLTRLLCLEAGHDLWAGSWEDHRAGKYAEKDTTIIKIHHADEARLRVADLVLCSHRELYGIAGSAIRMKMTTKRPIDVVRFLYQAVMDYKFYSASDKCLADFDFVQVTRFPVDALRTIQQYMGVDLNDARLAAIAGDAQSLPEYKGPRKCDPVTLMHPKHIARGRQEVPDDVRAAIRSRFHPWMR
ncbi:unnamed protein product, partial [marine sediment metagenome]